jgi:hypothetical protein
MSSAVTNHGQQQHAGFDLGGDEGRPGGRQTPEDNPAAKAM